MSPSRPRKSSSRRSSTGKTRATRAASAADEADDLPTLEPIEDDDLPELEPVDDDDLPELEAIDEDDEDALVRVTHAATDEIPFNLCLTVHVGEMEKSDVTDAIEVPLGAAVARLGDDLRWQGVLVEFEGDTMIPTAAKDRVGELVSAAKPRKIVVRRGWGDEKVHEADPPSVDVRTETTDGGLDVTIENGSLDAADLAFVLGPALDDVASTVSAQRVAFAFAGDEPPTSVHDLVRDRMTAAGAVRSSIRHGGGEHVLHDRDLEARVAVAAAGRDGFDTEINVTPADDATITQQAFDLVLPRASAMLDGRAVVARYASTPAADDVDALGAFAAAHRCTRFGIDTAGALDVIWPPLLRAKSNDKRALCGIVPSGRDAAAMRTAFPRDAARIGDDVRGRAVQLDWPADADVDADLRQIAIDALVGQGAASIAFSAGGENLEPVYPTPLSITTDGDAVHIELNTDAGKPAELIRVLEREFRAADLATKNATVTLTGDGAVSRSLRRSIRDELAAAGVARGALEEHGTADLLLPELLTTEAGDDGTLHLGADAGGRDASQVEAALNRELGELELADDATVTCTGTVDDVVLAALRERVARILDADGTQLYPTLFAAAERDGDAVTFRAAGAADAADDVIARQLERELPALLSEQGSLGGCALTLAWPTAVDPDEGSPARAIEQLVATGPATVHFAGGDAAPAQVFPEEPREPVVELGRKDDASPPLIMLGIDAGKKDGQIGVVEEVLGTKGEDLTGKRVLLVCREGSRDAPRRDSDPLVEAARRAVDPIAGAVLVHRAARRGTPAHFEVVHSSLDGLAVGQKTRDPRPSA